MNIKTHRPLAVASLAFALVAGACDLDLAGVNDNPNAPTDVPASSILPQGITSATSLILGYNLNLDLTEHWVQHTAEIQYGEEDLYQLRSTEVDNSFRAFYSGPLMDFERIIQKGQEAGDDNVTAVGMILQAWTFSVMTDMWGDIPYFEALAGEDEEQIIQPAYTPQSEIYPDLIDKLTQASNMIDTGASPFGSEDLIYGGDMEKWQKFANSLRLRLSMRMSEVDPTAAAAGVQAAVAAGVFESNADNAALDYFASPPEQNPWFEAIDPSVGGRPGDFRMSATLITTLQDLDDPRLEVYANPTDANGDYVGMPNGLEEHSFSLSGTSTIGPAMGAPDAAAQIQTYAEVEFLLAEAAERGWIETQAAAPLHYAAGVEASLEMWGASDAEIAAYLAQPEVAYTGIESIALQKWIALYGNGPEAFAEWRRLDAPTLTPGRDAVLPALPRRYVYADSEYVFNETSLQAAVSRQGPDELSTRIWWDVN